tara:strand:+ start:19056 stop:20669 length:1614 start_codon:yes stop_codon:yes gene_type:complete
MKLKLITVPLAIILMIAGVSGQGLSGNFKMTGVHVKWINVARDSGAAVEDVGSTHDLVLSWPSAAAEQFTWGAGSFDPGDVVAVAETPEAIANMGSAATLVAAAGIDLTVILNEDGSFEIPTSTYPSTDTENCSTFASMPTVAEQGTYEWDGEDDHGGFGIVESGVFDLFSMDATDVNHGYINVYRAEDGSAIRHVILGWNATDGIGSASGIDAEGLLNRQLGFSTAPADEDFVTGVNAAYGKSLNVGDHVTLGDNWPYDEAVVANWGYIFDPAGPDGELFSGDEPLQFTGYYMTYHDLVALATFGGAFNAAVTAGDDELTAAGAAASATLSTLGVDATVIAALGDLGALAWGAMEGILTAGGDIEDAIIAGVVTALGAGVQGAAAANIDFAAALDDCQDNFDGTNGRLIFEVGNQCVPNRQTRVVKAKFSSVEVLEAAEEDALPTEFALNQNYPNPFNPSTSITFDIPESGDVTLTVWNMLGEQVRTLVASNMTTGSHSVQFDGLDDAGTPLATGIYLYRLDTAKFNATKKMLLMK